MNEKVIASKDFGKWRVQITKTDLTGIIPNWKDENKLSVQFYDISQDKNKFPDGQFTGASYYLDTLLGLDEDGKSLAQMPELRLDFSIPAWTVSKEDCLAIYEWLSDFEENNMVELEDADIKKESELQELNDIDNTDAENLKNIRQVLQDSGIKNERTLDLMSKDILKMLKTEYDEDNMMDGIYLQPVIIDALQKKIEKITGKKPELQFGKGV